VEDWLVLELSVPDDVAGTLGGSAGCSAAAVVGAAVVTGGVAGGAGVLSAGGEMSGVEAEFGALVVRAGAGVGTGA
jgi:hypothetical protein